MALEQRRQQVLLAIEAQVLSLLEQVSSASTQPAAVPSFEVASRSTSNCVLSGEGMRLNGGTSRVGKPDFTH